MTNIRELTAFEMDQLREVVNIGASHASTALSQMLNKTVKITVPEMAIDNIENISRRIGNEEEVVTSVLLKILGEAPGIMVYIFPHTASTEKFVELVTKQTRKTGSKGIDEYDISVLREVGNILAGAALTAFSKFLNINLLQSVSESSTDMLGSVVNTLMAEMGQRSDRTMICKVSFRVEEENLTPELYFFIDPQATNKLLDLTSQKVS